MSGAQQGGWSLVKDLGRGIVAARKWILAYVVLLLIPSSIMLYTYYQRSSQILEEEVSQTMQQTLKQAGINLSYRMDHVRDISNSLFMNLKLYENLERSDRISEQIHQSQELLNLLESAQTNSDIVRARLFTEPTKVYGADRINLFPLESLKKRSWYQPIIDAGGGIVWTWDYRESFLDKGEQYIISCARMLRNPAHYDETMGVLMIDVSEKTITDVISELDFPSRTYSYIVDRSGTVIYSADRSLIGTKLVSSHEAETIGNSDEGIFKRTEGNEDLYVLYSAIHPTGWKLVVEVPKVEISRRTAALNQFSSIATLIGMTVMFLVLVFVLLAIIVQGMNRRVKTVLKMIRTEGIERLEERRFGSDGDFHLLERNVDHLIHRVKNLMEEVYQTKVMEREAQLRALQAQINPHFLYNTLDTINWLAVAREADDISQMVQGLSDYFRLSLNKGKDYVTVSDELDLAKVYLEIQQNRFPSSFTFIIEASLDTDRYMTPKLILQPIVENALLHGIRKRRGKIGTISIRVLLEDEDLLLLVTDDGIGMEEDLAVKLLTVPRPEAHADGSGSSYGLYNVNERIRLFAGSTYGLTIRSRPGEGTTVLVRLKAILMDERK
ncbi:sensor histidine kinase [Paenibacillus sp. N3.4]|uniref:sensor histidine kinase n=1 Tax=Paenibacillus sp. N3.4 TaxID=2603222 RepID=UPI0011CC0745|nr:sensor histidine kinase [Paenibacillus sp. N3.4]TXK78379.1 sensor histidine kinase [Paenibacillus sp. N3.4]